MKLLFLALTLVSSSAFASDYDRRNLENKLQVGVTADLTDVCANKQINALSDSLIHVNDYVLNEIKRMIREKGVKSIHVTKPIEVPEKDTVKFVLIPQHNSSIRHFGPQMPFQKNEFGVLTKEGQTVLTTYKRNLDFGIYVIEDLRRFVAIDTYEEFQNALAKGELRFAMSSTEIQCGDSVDIYDFLVSLQKK